MRFGHVLVCHTHPPAKLFESVPNLSDEPWFIFLHSNRPEVSATVEEECSRRSCRIFDYKSNRGLARSWNEGIKASLSDHCDIIMILNDDLFFYPEGYVNFRRFTEKAVIANENLSYVTTYGIEGEWSPNKGEAQVQDFACVCLPSGLIKKVGFFDQNFFPAYFEDTDYDRRCSLAGLEKAINPSACLEHERSSTLNSMSSEERVALAAAMRSNHSYLDRKWGGQGVFHERPFGADFTLAIEESRISSPYPGYDRETTTRMPNIAKAVIPADHNGVIYTDFMRELSIKRKTRRYLEVGVNTGNLIQHICADEVIGVDPDFTFNVNPMRNKRKVTFFQTTSDDFFSTTTIDSIGGRIDLAFLDGMHTFEYLLRDFYNTERICTRGSLIVMHDCLPLNEEMTHRNFAKSLEIGKNSSHPLYWTGDVWKIVLILKKFRPDLKVVFIDAPPTGLVCVTCLDPASTILETQYGSIVEEIMQVPNTLEEIENMYKGIDLVETKAVLNEYDHSLYFQI